MSATAEKLLVTKPRRTEVLDHGRVRQVFDVLNAPGLVVVWEGFCSEGSDFETISQVYELGNAVFDNASDAIAAWDQQRSDQEMMDALGHALLRWRHGLVRPLWQERPPHEREFWLRNARSFHELLSALGFEVSRRVPS